MPESTHVSLVS